MITLLRRIGSFVSILVGSVFWLALIAALVGPALYLELSGVDAPGIVTGKREEIRPNQGFWTRQLFVDVHVQTPTDSGTPAMPITVDAATFDGVAPGMPVMVHYVQNETMRRIGNFAFARLSVQPPFGTFLAVLGTKGVGILIGVGLWLACLTAWSKWRRWWLALGVFGVMVGGALLSGSSWQPAPRGPLVPATATVRATKHVDRVWGGRNTAAEDAVQPFNVVQLEFVPDGRSEPVVAVDVVDDGSLAGLVDGARLTIHYSAADPRQARIDGGTHTYWWKNMRSFFLIAGALGVIFGGGFVIRTLRRP